MPELAKHEQPPVAGIPAGSPANSIKPVLLIISGPPGAGKSTLARVLSDYLCLPVLSVDLIKAGADADMIVVGSHGAGGWKRAMGSTATKVAHHANVPVLVVPSEHRH